jgi:membrane protein CcdC involved in cytochrome C biogenesis
MGKKNIRNLFETFIDVGSGLILSTLIQMFIFPFFDLHPTILESFHIAVIFTIISMMRSWFWRTIFSSKKT